MDTLRYTFLADGSSDQALMPLLTWLLRLHGIQRAIQPEWADLRRLPRPPRTLADRVVQSIELYPCDLFFVHRDAEGESLSKRLEEIQSALALAARMVQIPPTIGVVPVRMQEAWLLYSEQAIRDAAGNPHGRITLVLPPLQALEQLPNAKHVLYELLRQASGLTGRRLKQFRVHTRTSRLAEALRDFTPLRALSAFRMLEAEIIQVVDEQHWQC